MMAFEKYIKVNGKLYGPYLYENKRVGKKVMTRYIGKPEKRNSLFWKKTLPAFFILLFFIVILSLFYFFRFPFQPTGKVALEISTLESGEPLEGILRLYLKEGELIPAETKVGIKLQRQEKEIPLSQILSTNQSSGELFVENLEIKGKGTGYGFPGEKRIYPEVFFILEIKKEKIEEVNETIEKVEEIPVTNKTLKEPITNETIERVEEGGIEEERIEEERVESEKPVITNETTKEPAEETLEQAEPEQLVEEPVEEPVGEQVEETMAIPNEPTASPAEKAIEETASESEVSKAGENEEGVSVVMTGAVIVEESAEKLEELKIIEGSVSVLKNFSYTLENGETAIIKEGSVKTKDRELDSSVLNMIQTNKQVILTTDYSEIEQGFGNEYLTDKQHTIEIELEDFNITAETGTLNIAFYYDEQEIVNVTREIEVPEEQLPEIPVENLTKVPVEENLTLPEENITRLPEENVTENITIPIEIINITNISLTKLIPDLTIRKNGSYILNLSSYFVNAESYYLGVESVDIKGGMINDEEIRLTPAHDFTGTISARIIAARGEERIESNVFSIFVYESNMSAETIQIRAEIGKPVKWVKRIRLERPENVSVRLPRIAKNVSVKKKVKVERDGKQEEIEEEVEEEDIEIEGQRVSEITGISGITGMVSLDLEFRKKKELGIARFFKNVINSILSIFSRIGTAITGRAITDLDKEMRARGGAGGDIGNEVELIIRDNATEYEIEYETEAPRAEEIKISDTEKQVRVYGPDTIRYENVLTYTTIPEIVKQEAGYTIEVFWIENQSYVDVNASDTNNNSLIDRIEWLTPHLSNQSFDVSVVEYYEVLVKTSDNVHSNLPRTKWTKKMLEEERKGNAKQGYILAVRPAGSSWGNLERDPKRAAIIRIPKSEWNDSWLEPEYDYSKPDYDLDGNLAGYEIKTMRKYKLPLENFMNQSELDALKNISYNARVDWSIVETIRTRDRPDMKSRIIENDYENRPTDMKLHGSSGMFTICPSGCNYTTLQIWENNEEADITAGGPAIANITGDWSGQADAGVVILGWTTNASSYIQIRANEDTRHQGKWNETAFRIEKQGGAGITDDEDYVRVEGLQFRINVTTSYSNGISARVALTANDNELQFSHNIIRASMQGGTSSAGIWIGITSGNQNAKIWNNVVYDYNNPTDVYVAGLWAYSGISSMYAFNNVLYNNSRGTYAHASGIINISNSAVFNNSDVDFYGTHAEIDYCASDDGDGTNAVTPSDWSTVFTDLNGDKDLHLLSTDTDLKDAGKDLSSDPNLAFSDDIDFETRDATWDIGADEYVAAGDTTPPDVTINLPIDTNYTQLDVNITLNEAGSCVYSLNNFLFNYTMTANGNQDYTATNSSIANGWYTLNASCNDTSSNFNVTESVNFQIRCQNYTNCTNGCLYVRNNSGKNVAAFDKFGNIDILGSFSTTLGTPDGSDLIFRNSSGNIAWIDDVTGNFNIAGTKTENTGSVCTAPTGSFVIRNNTGVCVSYLNNTGDLWLKGQLCENADIG